MSGITVERTPKSSRQSRWFSSLSKAASAKSRSQVTTRDACFIAGRSCGESLLGAVVAVAAVKKWLRVSQTTVSLVHSRALCLRPARLKKYCEVWRPPRPVAPMAASGRSPIRPPSRARAVARRRRQTASPF